MCLVCCQPEGAVSGAPCVKFVVNLKLQYAVQQVFNFLSTRRYSKRCTMCLICCQPEGTVSGAPCILFPVKMKVQ